jgi:hypothetical protein
MTGVLSIATRAQGKRNRVPECPSHPYIAAHVCPWCNPKPKKSSSPGSKERVYRELLERTVLAVVSERVPSSYVELAQLVNERAGLHTRAANVANTLRFLRHKGLTTVDIQRADERNTGE